MLNRGEPPRRQRPLALDLVDAIAARIGAGHLVPGNKLPSEAAIMGEFGVSRTVVREALSKLQASGLVQTRHGVGTFVTERAAEGGGLRIASAEQAATLMEVVAVVELRLALEAEAAALAAVRRDAGELEAMREAQRALARAIEGDGDTVAPDRRLHQEIASATRNAHFVDLMGHLADGMIPRARIDSAAMSGDSRRGYLWRVHAEHDSIVSAIANRDPEAARAAMRTHLSNSRDRLRQAQAAAEAAAASARR
jgi:DNA-binding FadR family transcriptional regulator